MAIYGINNVNYLSKGKQFSFIESILTIDDCFDKLIESLDDYDDDENYLNESFIEDIKDSFKYFSIKIREGEDEMLRQSTEAARQANEYRDELLNIVSTDKAKGAILDTYEYYAVTYGTPETGMYTYMETKNTTFSGIALDFNKILNEIINSDKKSIKKSYNRFFKKAYDIYRFIPAISKRNVKGRATDVAKAMADAIADQKKLVDLYQKSLDNMLRSVKNGMDLVQANKKNKDIPNIKYLKKYLTQQKKLYQHDFSVMYTNNRRIIGQSRACRDFIAKLNKN